MAKKDRNKVREALASPINPTGAGEDRVVRELVEGKMADASNREALEMQLALDQIVKGQASLLEMMKLNTAEGAKTREQVAELRKRMDETDEAERKFNEDQQRFIQDVIDKALSKKLTGVEADKLKANAAEETRKIFNDAQAKNAADRMRFEEEIQRMPKVSVASPGVLEIVNVNGRQTSRLVPEVIRIKHLTWVIPPGKVVEVPKIVAEVISDKRKSQQETAELEDALSNNLEAGELHRKMIEIKNRTEGKYDPTRAPSPI